jgi:4-hydroxyphenylpyruvate dioxygenase-like putative hemolysin
MSNVLIRDVSTEDLARIKAAADQHGTTLQAYLWETVHAQAAFLRRQDALARTARRLQGRTPAPAEARQAVLDTIDAANAEREAELSDRPQPR